MAKWQMRGEVEGHEDDYYEPGYADEGCFTILIHHGGSFGYVTVNDRTRRLYKNGRTQCFDFCSVDYMSVNEIDRMVEALKYSGLIYYHYKLYRKDLDVGLRRLAGDDDIRDMLNHIREEGCTLIQVYLEHGISTVLSEDDEEDVEVIPSSVVIEELEDEVASVHHKVVSDRGKGLVVYNSHDAKEMKTQPCSSKYVNMVGQADVQEEREIDLDEERDKEGDRNEDRDSQPRDVNGEMDRERDLNEEMDMERDIHMDDTIDPEIAEDMEWLSSQYAPTIGDRQNDEYRQCDEDEDVYIPIGNVIEEVGLADENCGDGNESEDEHDNEIPDYGMFPGNGYDFQEEHWPTADEALMGSSVRGRAVKGTVPSGAVEGTRTVDMNPEALNEKQYDSDELRSIASDSENEDVYQPYTDYNAERDRNDPHFVIGQRFANRAELKEAIDIYFIKQRRNPLFVKNDKARVRAKCRGNVDCPFLIYGSKMQGADTMVITTLHLRHNCPSQYVVKKATDAWVASQYVDKLRVNPNMPVQALRETVALEHQIGVSHATAYRAKRKAQMIIEGQYVEQYKKIYKYCDEVTANNPRTTALVRKDPEGRFQRCYICLGALKQGFEAGCRPIIGLDGAFLKGNHPGQILSAVGIDANDCIYPYAWAIVEKENKATWNWFCRILRCDLHITDDNESNWTFISDQQKGLEDALENIFPNSKHRFCVLHLYNNFKKDHKGKELKEIMWNIARASCMGKYKYWTEKLQKKNDKAYTWLQKKDPEHWCRSHFSTSAKCDLLLNNICECFNSFIKDARDKPLVTMLELIRCKVMKRIWMKRNEMQRKCASLQLCFKVQEKLEKIKTDSNLGIPHWNGGDKYEIHCPNDKHVVDISKRSCSCRKWDLTGIPCYHAVKAIYEHSLNTSSSGLPEDWVDDCYKVSTFMKMYSFCINPIRGEDQWEDSNDMCDPPVFHKQPGRPKKQRKRAPDEPTTTGKLTRGVIKLHCGRCGLAGHNRSSCTNPPKPQEPRGEPKKKGRPRKEGTSKQRRFVVYGLRRGSYDPSAGASSSQTQAETQSVPSQHASQSQP